MVIPAICIVLFVLYSVLIMFYWAGWKQIPSFVQANKTPSTRVSVIIPARNEEAVLGNLLSSLEKQTYPKSLTEIIVVDDHSTDSTASVVYQYAHANVYLIRLKDDHINSYKKKAIETGIASAHGNLIVTTDADCVMHENWLFTLVSFYEEHKPVFIAAPVCISDGKGNKLLSLFQQLDFTVLQGITGASVYKKVHSMCNGANLAYEKKVFNEAGGFAGIDSIASGDDMLLMHKIVKLYPGKVLYLKAKEAVVYTTPMKTWKDFFNQRIRWASKADKYDDRRIFAVLLLVYLLNFCFPVLLIMGFFNPVYLLYFAALLILKTLIEFPFVYSVSSFFNQKKLLKYFFFFQPFHIAYTIIAGWLGKFGSYEWKGRKVK